MLAWPLICLAPGATPLSRAQFDSALGSWDDTKKMSGRKRVPAPVTERYVMPCRDGIRRPACWRAGGAKGRSRIASSPRAPQAAQTNPQQCQAGWFGHGGVRHVVERYAQIAAPGQVMGITRGASTKSGWRER